MDAVIAILITVGGVLGVVWLGRAQADQRKQLSATQLTGLRMHRRTGEYPASCNWCKSTTLARKLIVFQRTRDRWIPIDIIGQLRSCADENVEQLASAFVVDERDWRRFCTERCVKEFFQAEHVAEAVAFSACEYCSVRYPNAVIRCPNCNAARTV